LPISRNSLASRRSAARSPPCGERGKNVPKALVQLREQPRSGHVFVFRSRRGDRLTLQWVGRDGLCVFAKPLEHGRFVWPPAAIGAGQLAPA
jgi:transposase